MVDVIIGGPPCQGFSLARGLRFVDDPRNHLYKFFVKAVRHFNPKWIVMENVQGITNIGKGAVLNQILEDFSDAGYEMTCKVINMAEYGVPQLRKRAIFVGNRIGVNFKFPDILRQKVKQNNPSKDLFELPPYASVNAAIGDLHLPIGNYFSHRANSKMRGPRNRDAHTEPAFTLRARGDEFALCEKQATSAFIPGPVPNEEIVYGGIQNELQEYFRFAKPNWSNEERFSAVNAVNNKMLKGSRKLTILELARLQSFPDWGEFTGTQYSQARQIGNAVPPLFAYRLFRHVFDYLS